MSEECSIESGMGSLIGPLLFLLYKLLYNDLCNIKTENYKIRYYLRPTTLNFFGDTWDSVFTYAQRGFNIICHWLALHTLTLNTSQTKYMTFSIRNDHRTLEYSPRHCCPLLSQLIRRSLYLSAYRKYKEH